MAAEKEHVLVGIRVEVEGRAGLLLADPGYHVPRVLTVMMDRAYPHTGPFNQGDDPQCPKEYHYLFNANNPDYVEWHERETRGSEVKHQTSLVYVARPYQTGVHVTERRNLVYNFRSLISRDQKGHLTSGLYFPVGVSNKDAQFTLFYDNGAGKHKIKYKFSSFMDPENTPSEAAEEIELCNTKLRYKDGELHSMLCRLAKIMANATFIDQLLAINDDICRISLIN